MQVYANSNWASLKKILFFFIILLIAFLPISSFLFFLKNDAFAGYFPPKFFMSESIHAGHLPLWNPYINFGFPQYGDMSGGFWSPITWIIASTAGYNAYTLTLEVLFYILLGGIGMYKLTGFWNMDKRVREIAGVAFMCSGYIIGHLQHFNWISGAAFLPWCLWSYLSLLKQFSKNNFVLTVLLFYFLVSSAHPGIIISAIYFFSAVLVFYIINKKENINRTQQIKQLFLMHAGLLLLFVLLCAGMIAGYLDILPFFVRGEKISVTASLGNPTSFPSWISALLPLATVKNDNLYQTDISMRNNYFSLVLLLFFLQACFSKKNSWQKFLLIAGFLFAALSAGGIFKTFAYKFIPLIGYVRLNGEFGIFTLLCFIIVAAIQLNKFIQYKESFSVLIQSIYYTILFILIVCIFYGVYFAVNGKDSFVFILNSIALQHTLPDKLKTLLDAVSFNDTLWIQGSIQLIIWLGIKHSLKIHNFNLLRSLVVADLIIASLLNIPFTGVGKTSVASIQNLLSQSPKGIPVPILQPINKIDTLQVNVKEIIGDWSMYNKQIGVKEEVAYPIILKNMHAYFETNESNPRRNFLNYPFIFVEGSQNSDQVVIQSFSPDKIALRVLASNASNLILQQNYYPHWYFKNGEHTGLVDSAGINFMKAPLNQGENNIEFNFEPTLVKRAMLLSAILFITLCLLLVLPLPFNQIKIIPDHTGTC
ncbi:hypothetical protein QWZ08_05075 [Ferruginibacter paludis]|uniref:hypothetical protein n=1 Tax=Ferruginibacter paludis TaxID=1310417 RepID=UPI0025B318BD|nr:hypothetical protein [Ferruginibacter paludis]MDN3654985.1 hypothetical protein [Ferruginibacter paludis]